MASSQVESPRGCDAPDGRAAAPVRPQRTNDGLPWEHRPTRLECSARNPSIPDADIRDMDPLEAVRRGDRARRVRRQSRSELRALEGRPEVPHRLPDGVVEEDAAPPDAAMQLGGDEAGLPL